MVKQKNAVVASSEVWGVSQFRATFFGSFDPQVDLKDLWPKGEITIDKESSNPKTGERTIEGSRENQKIVVVVFPIRIDLIVAPPEPVTINPSSVSIPVLGSTKKVFTDLTKLIGDWIAQESFSKTNFSRVAFGAELIMESPSSKEAYDRISTYIPFKVSAADSSDFIFQINKPSKSKVEKQLKINRLTKWDILKFNAEVSSVGDDRMTHSYPEVRFCHLSLDINTAMSSSTLNSKQVSSLFSELVTLGDEISEKGIK